MVYISELLKLSKLVFTVNNCQQDNLINHTLTDMVRYIAVNMFCLESAHHNEISLRMILESNAT